MSKRIKTVGVVAGGPKSFLPDLSAYQLHVDYWIGADDGCNRLIELDIVLDLAVGDFDSVNEQQYNKIQQYAGQVKRYPVEKDYTDLELAIEYAISCKPLEIYLFGVTGGRMDHTLANLQQLKRIDSHNIQAIIIDNQNMIQLFNPGIHDIETNRYYPYISFIAFSEKVVGLSLQDFYYPLTNYALSWGSTRCLSNKLLSKKGTFSFDRGILIMIKSRDVLLK